MRPATAQPALPFLWGAQYYRAPTPGPECWDADVARMARLGFNSVKFWAQWRWAHRGPDEWYFDDLDRLHDLAAKHGLAVTINTLFDVVPNWVLKSFPDSLPLRANGLPVLPAALAPRQIGGSPGPCLQHPGVRAERRRFLAEVVKRYRAHPAFSMWDVWNEPEQNFVMRPPRLERGGNNFVCYCPHCLAGFTRYVAEKYQDVDRLNAVWGRCYRDWSEVEAPITGDTLGDMIDWREFHLQMMNEEAAWRIALVRELDPVHPVYLHVVPNTMRSWNSLGGVDDFEIFAGCDLIAASCNETVHQLVQFPSAANGRTIYNVESHLNHGMQSMHQRVLRMSDLVAHLVPQLAAGIRGFQFWQFRSETLGREAPAWGIVRPDGSDRPITRAIAEATDKLRPHLPTLQRAFAAPPQIGVWKSRRNEIHHLCTRGTLDALADSVEAYLEAFYWMNYPQRIVDHACLEAGALDALKLIVLPAPYALSEPEAAALDRWVRAGGVLVSEAHLGAYDVTTFRHSGATPGAGLATRWGFSEVESTSAFHLKTSTTTEFGGDIADDVKKALAAQPLSGGKFFPISCRDRSLLWGAERVAFLAGDNLHIEGTLPTSEPCAGWKQIDRGRVYYAGTHLGEAAKAKGDAGLRRWLQPALNAAGLVPTWHATTSDGARVRLDVLAERDAQPAFLCIRNGTDQAQSLTVHVPVGAPTEWIGVFTGARLAFLPAAETTREVAPFFCDLLRPL